MVLNVVSPARTRSGRRLVYVSADPADRGDLGRVAALAGLLVTVATFALMACACLPWGSLFMWWPGSATSQPPIQLGSAAAAQQGPFLGSYWPVVAVASTAAGVAAGMRVLYVAQVEAARAFEHGAYAASCVWVLLGSREDFLPVEEPRSCLMPHDPYPPKPYLVCPPDRPYNHTPHDTRPGTAWYSTSRRLRSPGRQLCGSGGRTQWLPASRRPDDEAPGSL